MICSLVLLRSEFHRSDGHINNASRDGARWEVDRRIIDIMVSDRWRYWNKYERRDQQRDGEREERKGGRGRKEEERG